MYDSLRHRLWILGQRCHHGATGSLLAATACLGLMVEPGSHEERNLRPASLLAIVATGGALMAHDWKDHSIWFERGHGTQP
ncbi:MAG: hypothetical protein ACYC91_10385 [Solirubrobacteraceae bacterium]